MREEATNLGVTHHVIRTLIKQAILPAEQVVPGAPYQIRATDLDSGAMQAAIARKAAPCRPESKNRIPMFSVTYEGGAL